MKTLMILALTLMTSNFAIAEDFFGTTVFYSQNVKVKTDRYTNAVISRFHEQDKVLEYKVGPLTNAAIYTKYISLEMQGAMDYGCNNYLGQLEEDFTVTMKTKDGIEKTTTILAADSKIGRVVSVFGGYCDGDLDVLRRLVIDVKEGAGIEVK